MNPITLIFCIIIIWSTVVHHVAAPLVEGEEKIDQPNVPTESIPPLVKLVYGKKNKWYSISLSFTENTEKPKEIFTDLTEAKTTNLTLPLGNMELIRIELLCANPQSDSHEFKIKKVIDEIDKFDANAEDTTCENYSGFFFRSCDLDKLIEIGFKISSDIVTSIITLQIHPYFEDRMPKSIQHIVRAHMHSNDYNKQCEDMEFGKDTLRNILQSRREIKTESDMDTYFRKFIWKPDDSNYTWRQLVPMQDFKGIYHTRATCTYANYVLLHEKVIENLQKVEEFIRQVADVINEVNVVTGTILDDSTDFTLLGPSSIPKIIIKEIIHFISENKPTSFLMVIHNKKTDKICGSRVKNTWGWPEYNGNEEGIGTTYFCSTQDEQLNYPDFFWYYAFFGRNTVPPFDLHKVKHENHFININVLEKIQKKQKQSQSKQILK